MSAYPKHAKREEQFAFMELVLGFEGLLTNERLRRHLGVTNVSASRLIGAYREMHPRNIQSMSGDGRGRYCPSSDFSPQFTELTTEAYFRVAAPSCQDLAVEYVAHDFTAIEPAHFREIQKALRESAALQVVYRSMTHPKGVARVLHPKAFVFASRRWHLRAFDEHSDEHRDFNLARLSRAECVTIERVPPADIDWDKFVDLVLCPHPQLSADQQMLIRDELMQGAAARRVRVRKALVRYALAELAVAQDAEQQPPPDFQLYLQRIDESDRG